MNFSTMLVNPGTMVPTPSSAPTEGGYVKGTVTYTILDDLTVTPSSTISSIAMLRFGVSEGVAAVRCLPMCSFPMRRQIPRFPPSRQSNSRLKKVEAPVTVLRVLWPVEGRNGEQTNYVLHRNTLANIQLKTGSVQNFTICVFQTC
ncbi:hypothetical protein V6N11_019888 [Hibiscus sabdariffa]|uniref:Uncharacterized protein n=2 Tax=Hibiscus sabdariffa TaxID=183260 RepID=A0ABR2C6G7_9ROSI